MHIIYYGSDSEAAEAQAAEVRKGKRPAQVRHAQFFDRPEKADEVTVLDCVSEFDRTRINAAYGNAASAPAVAGEPTDDELRAALTAAGKAPHPQTGRTKLLEKYNALKAEE